MHKRPILSIKSSSARKTNKAGALQQSDTRSNATTPYRQTGGGEEKRKPQQARPQLPGGDSYFVEGRRVPLLDVACNELYTR